MAWGGGRVKGTGEEGMKGDEGVVEGREKRGKGVVEGAGRRRGWWGEGGRGTHHHRRVAYMPDHALTNENRWRTRPTVIWRK